MKSRIHYILVILTMFYPFRALSQDGWFYRVDATSSSFYLATILNAIGSSANEAMYDSNDHIIFAPSYGVNYMQIKDDNKAVYVDYGEEFGLTLRDVFSNVSIGGKIGYQGAESPLGIYITAKYRLRQFRTHMEVSGDNLKHRIHSFEPGVGIYLSPFCYFKDDWDWCPVFEVGTSYVLNFGYSGGYDGGTDELNDGWLNSYALGPEFDNAALLLGCEISHYNLFNQNFSPDGGYSFPYNNVKTKNFYFYIKYNLRF